MRTTDLPTTESPSASSIDARGAAGRYKPPFRLRLAAFATLVVLLGSASSYLTRDIRAAMGGELSEQGFWPPIAAWFVWLSLLWLALEARSFILVRSGAKSWRRALVEAALCGTYSTASVAVTQGLLSRAFGRPPLPGDLAVEDLWPMMLVRSALFYGFFALALSAISVELERRRAEQEAKQLLLQRETLGRQLASARLELLQAQLNPHFLFNALHAIGGSILTEDKRTAHRSLVSLSELLRRSLRQGESATSDLEEEFRTVRQYLELEQLRLGARLSFEVEAGPGTEGVSVPSLLLLPIVENAVTHGVAPSSRPCHIEVSASRHARGMELRVRDNGDGGTAPGEQCRERTGIGLRNTDERLEVLYGGAAKLEVRDLQPVGTQVCVLLPLGRAAALTPAGAAG